MIKLPNFITNFQNFQYFLYQKNVYVNIHDVLHVGSFNGCSIHLLQHKSTFVNCFLRVFSVVRGENSTVKRNIIRAATD